MNVKKTPLSALRLNDGNPRIIKDHKFQKLVKSILTFPEMLRLREVVCDETMLILGGNMRCRALMHIAQMTEQELKQELKNLDRDEYTDQWLRWHDSPMIDVKVAEGLSDEQKKEFIVKDNVGYGEWDWDILANEWDVEELSEWGVDLPIDWGNGVDSEDADLSVEEDDFDEEKDEVEPVCKRGDIWMLGQHTLMCGDSTSESDVARLMDGKKADMVFTDPPYGYKYQSNMRTKSKKFDVLKNDDKILDFMPAIKGVTKGFVFICTTWKVLDKWLPLFNKYYDLSNMIIWDKGGGGIGDLEHTFLTDYEIILCANNSKKITGKRIGSVWSIAKDNANDYVHATQKPVKLPAMAIENTTNKNDIVLDLFGGSGATLIACEQLDRKCYMMELDPHYCDVIIARWEKLTGNNATKIERQ